MTTYLDSLLGTSGKASFTVTTASYTQPSVGSSVTIAVLDSSWIPVGIGLFVGVGGSYQVTAVSDSTHITIKNLGGSSNAAPAATVATSQRVASSGVAGATGPVGPTGTPAIVPVDILVTSNVAVLSGAAQTFDGVAATAGKRMLLVGQTTTSQNGIYTAAAGAWVYGFAVDADVVSALGVFVYVKPGGLSLPAEGQNWQLISGTTVSGAKAYARSLVSQGSLSPVDYVQIYKLGYYFDPDWTYNAGAKTLTAAVNGVLNPLTFGTSDIVGKRLEVNWGGAASTNAGIYVGVSNGSAGTPASMVRATDFNNTAALSNGARYLVKSGAFSGTQRAMVTVAPTLDTTPILLDRIRPTNTLEVDLSAPPYNIKDYPGRTEWVLGGPAVDNGPIISQFLADYAGKGVVGRLPVSNGGCVVCSTPILYVAGGPVLKGAGQRASQLYGEMSGGPLIIAQKLTPPQLSAFALDTATNATAISFDVDTNGNAGRPYWLNLTHAGVIADSWVNFEYTATHRWGAGGAIRAVSSCRGARQSPNGGASIQDPMDSMFKLTYDVGNQQLTASLRVWDQTKGVYGAVTHTGTGTAVMTGDATIKPNADAPIVVRVVTGGTIGVAGIVLQFSNNAESGVGVTWSPTFALGTATSITINHPTIHLEQGTWKFNFAAGTMVAGDTYYSNCTGTLQTISITSDVANPVAINTDYLVTVQYDGANMRMYCSKPGLARDAGSNTTNRAVTGVVRQYPWEQWLIGPQMNEGLVEGHNSLGSGSFYMGSVLIKSSSVAIPPSTTPTTLTQGAAGERFFFCPKTTNAIKSPDNVVRAWHGFNKGADSIVVPRSEEPNVRVQMSLGGLEDFNTLMGDSSSPGRMGMSILSVAWNQRVFRNLQFNGGLHGWCNIGPDFFSDDYDMSYKVTWGPAFTGSSINANWHGVHQFTDGSGPMLVAMSTCFFHSHGMIDVNCESAVGPYNLCDYGTLAPIVLYFVDGHVANLQMDPENQARGPQGRELINISVQFSFTIGNAFASIDFSKYAYASIASSVFNGQLCCEQTIIEAGYSVLPNTAVGAAFTIRDAKASPIKLGQNFITNGNNFGSLCDRPGYIHKFGGRLPAAILSDANATLLWSDPNGTSQASRRVTFKMNPGTTTANRTLTLNTVDMQESDVHRVTLGVQGNNVIFVNGGPAGGTILTATAGFMGTLEFRMKQDGNLEWI